MNSGKFDSSVPPGEGEVRCDRCGQPLSEREREVCLADPKRFNGELLCFGDQRRYSVCPAIRIGTPGGH